MLCDLQDEKIVSKFNFENFGRKKNEIVFQLKAYQRMLRIMPTKKQSENSKRLENNQLVASLLLQQGIHSALQIAAMTRKDFITLCVSVFGNDQNMATIMYQNAQEKRSAILVQYMSILQNGEPHINATRFN